MKTLLKFMLLVILTTVAFSIVSAIMPYSAGFQAANKNADPSILLYVLFTTAWTCFVIFYLVKHSPWSGYKLMLALTGMLFFVTSFMTQIETLFFGYAFKVLTTVDILLISIANGTLVFVGVPLCMALFKKGKAIVHTPEPFPKVSALPLRLVLIGIAYVVVYFTFGYFVAWQNDDLRVFYSGHTDDHGFFTNLINNYTDHPGIYPFQFLRGVLFGAFVLPLVWMFPAQPKRFLSSLLLVFSSIGISLIIPNFLFPDSVRWSHFAEMMSSMCVFAVVVWWIYYKFKLSSEAIPVSQRI